MSIPEPADKAIPPVNMYMFTKYVPYSDWPEQLQWDTAEYKVRRDEEERRIVAKNTPPRDFSLFPSFFDFHGTSRSADPVMPRDWYVVI